MRDYGPYRPDEAIVPTLWLAEHTIDGDPVWVEVHEIPAWLHEQRRQLACYRPTEESPVCAAELGRETGESTAGQVLPGPQVLSREVRRPFDGSCRRCGTALTTRANKRAGSCSTCRVLVRLGAAERP